MLRNIGLWAATTLAVTLLGPFSTFTSLPAYMRGLYWALVIGVSMLVVALGRSIVNRTRLRTASALAYDCAVAVIFVLCFPPILHVINLRFATGPMALTPLQIALVIGAIVVIQISLRALLGLHANQPASRAQIDDPLLPETGLSPLQARIPAELRGDIRSISSANHHVNVVTHLGSTQVLMRFSDALREVTDLQGQQIHRSHWVADDAVKTLMYSNGKLAVILTSGATLPVSPSFEAAALARWPLANGDEGCNSRDATN